MTTRNACKLVEDRHLTEDRPGEQWGITIPQTASLMASEIGDGMSSPTSGATWSTTARRRPRPQARSRSTNERYRQILKIPATKSGAVLIGGSATQAALPPLETAQRSFKGDMNGLALLVTPTSSASAAGRSRA